MHKSRRLIQAVKDALLDPKVLDRDLIQDLVILVEAQQIALEEVCRAQLVTAQMDKNIAQRTNELKQACDGLMEAYTQQPAVDEEALAEMLENRLNMAQQMAAERAKVVS